MALAADLSPAQRRAIGHVAARSAGHPADPALRVTLNFHPDRLVAGLLILDALARDGRYRSQFETGTSNGGLTAHPGGDRWQWESRIFGGAYDRAPAQERPVYGALNDRHTTVGGSPRFGSAHLRLAPQTLARSTFCYPDSALQPFSFGVASAMSLIALAEADRAEADRAEADPAEAGQAAAGRAAAGRAEAGRAGPDQAAAGGHDPLDEYIEAQVHGPVRLHEDVDALVLDPCFRGTAVEQAARRFGCPVEWHAGFRLTAAELARHPTYRGREYVELGLTLARQGTLDPRVIGDAARDGVADGQALKRVWHYLARYGAPTETLDR